MDAACTVALIEAVRRTARDEVMPRFRSLAAGEIDTKSGPGDFVTIADRRAEAALRRAVASLLPGVAFVGEEAVSEDAGALDGLGAELSVVVDPVDGTANFVHGIAVFGMIVAVLAHGEPIFGLLYDPVLDDWVAARRGQGAVFARPGAAPRRLCTRRGRDLPRMTGFVHHAFFPDAARRRLAARAADVARSETLRCSCHEYRQLALGHADFMLSAKSAVWDHAAGALVLAEAGGGLGRLEGGAWVPGDQASPLLAAADPAALDGLRDHFGAAR